MFEIESNAESNIVYTNFAGEMKAQKEKVRLEYEQKYKKEFGVDAVKKITKLNLNCYWCEKMGWDPAITNAHEDHYYVCSEHGTVFCDFCAKNFYKSEIQRTEAPKCRQNPLKPHVDCIYEKKEIHNAE